MLEELQKKLRLAMKANDEFAAMENLSDEQTAEWMKSCTEAETLQTQIELHQRNKTLSQWAKEPANPLEAGDAPGPRSGAADPKAFGAIAARPRVTRVKSFKPETFTDEKGYQITLSAEEKAYRFGMWMLGIVFNGLGGPQAASHPLIQQANKFCKDNGIMTKAATEAVNSGGGYLVPPEFGTDLIDLREYYGVFRRNAKVVPMASDTRSDPRRVGGLTPYFVGELTAATESQKSWDRVNLTAKKLMVLTKMSSELVEDAIISLGDDLAQEVAYAFALKEDQCGFLGDGTSTYGGINGLANAFFNLSATRANIAGLVVAANQTSSNGYGEVVLNDFLKMQGKLPQYAAMRGDVKWYCHRNFFYTTMVSLALAAGGVTEKEVIAGQTTPEFLGYPVEFVQALSQTFAVDTISCYFGNLRMTASFGDRRMTTIALSEHLNFDLDEIAMRGTERFDINVHDVGNQSGTASSRVPGPMIALATGAS